MNTIKDYITIGYHREDGDFDIIATFNLDNVRENFEEDFKEILHDYAKQIAKKFDATLLYRQDTPDVVDFT